MNIEQLFCTPDQGRKLAELVPGLTSVFVWADQDGWIIHERVDTTHGWDGIEIQPALTLQELGDLAKIHIDIEIVDEIEGWLFSRHTYSSTAPKLAAWVFERLEKQK